MIKPFDFTYESDYMNTLVNMGVINDHRVEVSGLVKLEEGPVYDSPKGPLGKGHEVQDILIKSIIFTGFLGDKGFINPVMITDEFRLEIKSEVNNRLDQII